MAGPIMLDQTTFTGLSGTQYLRCSQIIASNPINQTPYARCQEEQVTTLSDGTQTVAPTRALTLAYDPSASIPIIDPTTGQPTGAVMPMPQVFAVLFSIYFAARAASQ